MNIKRFLIPLRTALVFTIVMFVLCGLVYPFLVTGLGQLIFPSKANGSMIYVDDKAVGSSLIGQDFTDPRFMKCRPSAVSYNTYTKEEKEDGTYGGVSTGSNNFAPTNPKLAERVQADMEAFLLQNTTIQKEDIPTDLLTASGSGLDPHISPESAAIQLAAISEHSGLSTETLEEIVKNNTTGKLLGVFGGETVNVLGVNLEIAEALEQQ